MWCCILIRRKVHHLEEDPYESSIANFVFNVHLILFNKFKAFPCSIQYGQLNPINEKENGLLRSDHSFVQLMVAKIVEGVMHDQARVWFVYRHDGRKWIHELPDEPPIYTQNKYNLEHKFYEIWFACIIKLFLPFRFILDQVLFELFSCDSSCWNHRIIQIFKQVVFLFNVSAKISWRIHWVLFCHICKLLWLLIKFVNVI